jgi:streptomycin 6-kinase
MHVSVQIPPQLHDAVTEDDDPARREWVAALPARVTALASEWGLELGNPYVPGGQSAWVAPARNPAGDELALKVGWRHREAEHEADALRLWDGDGAVRCFATHALEDTTALLLERCVPGIQLKDSVPEPEQDEIIAGLMRRLWEYEPPPGHPFGSLQGMCDEWATNTEVSLARGARGSDLGLARGARGFDPGLTRAGIEILRELPKTADRSVLLSTDLHAGNVLSSRREPWLVIDPKPFVGDPAFDPVQHMLNCHERLATDPAGVARRMAELLGLKPERVQLWLFARCAQESLSDASLREPARRLAP